VRAGQGIMPRTVVHRCVVRTQRPVGDEDFLPLRHCLTSYQLQGARGRLPYLHTQHICAWIIHRRVQAEGPNSQSASTRTRYDG
jgi:hypothetical protein